MKFILMRIRVLIILAVWVVFGFVDGISASTDFYPKSFEDFRARWADQVPYPPENLVSQLLNTGGKSSQLHAVVMAHGRSLERSTTDFKQPRTVMAWRSGNASTSYPLFIGFTPRNEQLEVIAWNWNTREFDFFLIKDYAPGKKQRILNANTFGCVACHQGRVPIFSEAAWNETSFNPKILATLKNRTQDPFAQKWIKGQWHSSRSALSPSDFDLAIRSAAELKQNSIFAQNVCGGDLDCRRDVLESILIETRRSGSSFSHFGKSDLERRVQSFLQNWPQDSFGIPSSRLEDRFLPAHDVSEVSAAQDPMRPRRRMDRISHLSLVDPNFQTRYASVLSFNETETAQIRRLSPEQIRRAVRTEQIQTLLRENWLPNESRLIQVLNEAIRSPLPIQSPSWVDWQPRAEAPRLISDPNRPRKSTAELFQEYCYACHKGLPNNQPQKLPLSNLTELRRYVGTAGRTVSEVLNPSRPLMPPLGSPQPSLEEMQQMREAVQNE